jgi:hypothetical protein
VTTLRRAAKTGYISLMVVAMVAWGIFLAYVVWFLVEAALTGT